jgi:hypothetical protein
VIGDHLLIDKGVVRAGADLYPGGDGVNRADDGRGFARRAFGGAVARGLVALGLVARGVVARTGMGFARWGHAGMVAGARCGCKGRTPRMRRWCLVVRDSDPAPRCSVNPIRESHFRVARASSPCISPCHPKWRATRSFRPRCEIPTS